MILGLAGHESGQMSMLMNQSNLVNNTTTDVHSRADAPLNVDHVLGLLEDSFCYLLNNPCCYSEKIYKFFDKHFLFICFPHVDAFLRTYRLTGVSMVPIPQPI